MTPRQTTITLGCLAGALAIGGIAVYLDPPPAHRPPFGTYDHLSDAVREAELDLEIQQPDRTDCMRIVRVGDTKFRLERC